MDVQHFENIEPRAIDNPSREIFTRTEWRKASANKLLAVLLSGEEVSRHNCQEFGIADFNASIHSMASDLVHRRSIPVSRRYDDTGVAWYFITDQDRAEFLDPERRPEQAARVRRASTAARIHRSLARAMRTIRGALEFPEMSERHPFIVDGIRRIHTESGRAIKKINRREIASTAVQADAFEATDTRGGFENHG